MRHATPDEPTPALKALDDALIHAARTTRQPRRWRPKLIGALTALAVAVVAATASYGGASYAYNRSEAHTDHRIAVLEGDLSQRRAAAVAANASRDAQIAELQAVLCVTLDHLAPRDTQVQALRKRYGCTDGVYPLPSATPTRTR